VSPVFRNRSATSFVWKGRSSISRSRLSNSVISSAVLGFLILFNAREMCSSRRRGEFGIFRIAGPSSRKMNLAYSSQGANVSMGLEGMQTGVADYVLLAGSSLRSNLPIATGWCSPVLPINVYERSKPSGPSTFISQLSFARDPTIDTRHSPGLSLRTCSMTATISPRARASPVFCISIMTAMSPTLYKAARSHLRAVESRLEVGGLPQSQTTSGVSGLSKNHAGDCRPLRRSPVEMVLHNS
jgi:hypothetical protein